MDSSTRTLSELQPPDSRAAIERTFEGYRTWLARQTPEQLSTELTRLNILLEQQKQQTLNSLVASGPLSGWIEQLDRIQLRSIERDPRSSDHRGRAAQASRTSRQPSPFDRLLTSTRLGPRLAAKLVAASARASARRDR